VFFQAIPQAQDRRPKGRQIGSARECHKNRGFPVTHRLLRRNLVRPPDAELATSWRFGFFIPFASDNETVVLNLAVIDTASESAKDLYLKEAMAELAEELSTTADYLSICNR